VLLATPFVGMDPALNWGNQHGVAMQMHMQRPLAPAACQQGSSISIAAPLSSGSISVKPPGAIQAPGAVISAPPHPSPLPSTRVAYAALSANRVISADSPAGLAFLGKAPATRLAATGVVVGARPAPVLIEVPVQQQVQVQVETVVPVEVVEAQQAAPTLADEVEKVLLRTTCESRPIVPNVLIDQHGSACGGLGHSARALYGESICHSGVGSAELVQRTGYVTHPGIPAPTLYHEPCSRQNEIGPFIEQVERACADLVYTTDSPEPQPFGSQGSSVAAEVLPEGGEKVALLHHMVPIVAMPVLKDQVVAPFSPNACGENLSLSDDRYVATRDLGCRGSVVIGSAPLTRQSRGLFFEVEVCQVVDGWMGGLGIGVTHTAPGQLMRVPDKGACVPGTFIAGYSGRMFLDGKEKRICWHPDELRAGQRVGLLLTGDGKENFSVFVDGVEVVFMEGAALREAGLRDEPLYPIVDVNNATLAVALTAIPVAP